MRILVAVKRVPITGGRIVLTDDAQAIDTRHLGFTISPHEECAAEEAVRIVEAGGGSATVLTLGPPEAEEQLRDALAIGVDDAVHLVTGGEEWDPQATAAAIVGVARAADPPYDLLLFGNESADAGNFQIGARVAHALGLPWLTGVKALAVEGGRACGASSRGRRRARHLPAGAARGGRCAGGAQPAALPVGARPAARQAQAARGELAAAPAGPAREARAAAAARVGQAGADPGRRTGCGPGGGGRARGARAAMSAVLVLVEHAGGEPDELSLQALALARGYARGARRRAGRLSGRLRRRADGGRLARRARRRDAPILAEHDALGERRRIRP